MKIRFKIYLSVTQLMQLIVSFKIFSQTIIMVWIINVLCQFESRNYYPIQLIEFQ